MEEVINNFIAWWKCRDMKLAKELFHANFQYDGGSRVHSKEVWLGAAVSNPPQDLKILKSFSCNNEATVILEETDEVTKLYYRHSIYIKVLEGKIVQVLETKESVEK